MTTTFTVTYDAGNLGSVTLNHPTTTISQNVVRSKTGHFTSAVNITITVRALIATSNNNNQNLDVLINEYKQVLMTVGGKCTVNYTSGTPALVLQPSNVIDDGPYPQTFNVVKFYGNKTAMIEWEIIGTKMITDETTSDDWAWVDFAYTINTTINPSFYQQRNISGVLQINASHPSTAGMTADAFRDTIEANLPPVPSDGVWRRTERTFRLDETGNYLFFTITDEQKYTGLPPGIVGGNISVTSTSEPMGKSRFTLTGFLEGSPVQTRAYVQDQVEEIIFLFLQGVVIRIIAETYNASEIQNGWALSLENTSYTHHWQNSRVEFQVSWLAYGTIAKDYWEGTKQADLLQNDGVQVNNNYMAHIAIDWLAFLSQSYGTFDDEGPYTALPVTGRSGTDRIAPVLILNELSRMPEGFNASPGTITPQNGYPSQDKQHNKQSSVYISWEQSYSYQVDRHLTFLPVLQTDTAPIIQQMQNTSIYLIVTGIAKSYNQPPVLPAPPFSAITDNEFSSLSTTNGPQSILVSSKVVPHAPTSDLQYTLEWQYVYRIIGGVPQWLTNTGAYDINQTLKIPFNPMVPQGFEYADDGNDTALYLPLPLGTV